MLLTIDVGNTESVMGLFENSSLAAHWRYSTWPERTVDELSLLVRGLLRDSGHDPDKLTAASIASVVPPVTPALAEMCRRLAVPVLRNAHAMSFAKIESEIKRLATATRDGKLGIEELSGGTFTVTNGGVFGSLLSTPILNPPQSAILGMHKIEHRPVAIDGKVEIRPMMYVALSYDHRLIDGRESVTFLVRVKELLEDPARLMLEV